MRASPPAPATTPSRLGVVLLTLVWALVGSAATWGVEQPWLDAPFATPGRVLLQATRDLAGDDDVDMLLVDTTDSYDARGRRRVRRRLIYRIASPEGVEKWSVLRARWSPWHQERPEVRARVITPGGREHRLDPGALAEGLAASPDMALFDDRRVLSGPLPALEVGAVVEEETYVVDREPYFSAGVVVRHGLALSVAVHRGRLTVEFPSSLPLRYRVRRMPGLDPLREVRGERTRLTFHYGELAAFSGMEEGLPYHQPRFPQVVLATGRSWNAVATAYSSWVDASLAGSDLRATVDALELTGDSQIALVQGLLDHLRREIRYSGLELAGEAPLPTPPAVVLERKIASSKDYATLLTALLRSRGIPAYPALIKAGLGRDVEPGLPGLGPFNHALVYVPAAPPLWIDPAHPFTRAGELPLQAQNRLALPLTPSAQKLILTPSTNSVDNRIVETREVFLAERGPGRVVETSVYRGAAEREVRALFAGLDRDDVGRQLEGYAAATYLAEGINHFDYTEPHDLSQPFALRFEARAARSADVEDGRGTVGILPDALLGRLPPTFFRSGPRRQGEFVFAEPAIVEWRYRITPAAGMKVQSLPRNERWTRGSATLSYTFEEKPRGVVIATLRFDSGHRRITAEEFEALRDWILSRGEADAIVIRFESE